MIGVSSIIRANMAAAEMGGVYAAMVTPTLKTRSPSNHLVTPQLGSDEHTIAMLKHLHDGGCHGSVLFGTTGEFSSFTADQRIEFAHNAMKHAPTSDFKFVVNTGSDNLETTVKLTRAAFDSGVDAVMLPPPYYFKNIPADGMRNYFREVVRRAVPRDGRVLLYHFPQMHSFGIPFQVIRDLTEAYPDVVVGVKDSQDDLSHSLALRNDFPRFGVFAGSDSLFTSVLAAGGVGCITALANLTSPLLRRVWDAHVSGKVDNDAQDKLNKARAITKGVLGPALIKHALARMFPHKFPQKWEVALPLLPFPEEKGDDVANKLKELLK